MGTILVADDEERVRTFLTRSLGRIGHTVVSVPDGVAALHALETQQVNLVLLDVIMPRANGLQVLTELRNRGDDTPVIVLSAVSEVSARVEALERGAVDFVTKPFHTAELMARVRRHMAHDAPSGAREQRYLAVGEITLDLDRRAASVGPAEVSLTEREFSLLAHLMRRAGGVCSREELLHDVWDLAPGTNSNVVDVCLGRLRAKLVDLPVETIRGVGYCFQVSRDG